MMRGRFVAGTTRRLVFGVALAFSMALSAVASAQQTTTPGGGGQTGGPGGGGGGAAPTPAPAPAPAVPFYPGGVAPPPPGGVLGGGNVTSSSSRPVTGNETDKFDLLPRSGAGGSMRGSDTGPVFDQGGGRSLTLGEGVSTGVHPVRKGDTLWAICETYFRNPYQWPRIWSYNPQIQNPHWIYPGDQVRLRQGMAIASQPESTTAPAQAGSLVDRRRQVPPDTVFLRDQGFIEDEDTLNWGQITGAREDKMFMTNFDEVYLRIGPDHDVKIGQELTVFRSLRKVEGGQMIQLQGTVRVDQWNPKDRVARAQVTETLDVIERGARIGPIGRRFEVVAPVRNDQEVRAEILTSVHPHPFYGQNQVVFINKGEAAGLKLGNRLFVVRRGDAWHQSMVTREAAQRVALESESPAEIERIPRRDDAQYPEEVVGELRVLAVRKGTATCMLTRATKEIEVGDQVVARKGY